MNTVVLSGRLTKDPELRVTTSETSVATFTLAVDRPGVKDKTDFIRCVAWRATADFINRYFGKGDPMEVTGKITTRTYDDRNGNKQYLTEVVCDHVGFTLSKPRRDEAQKGSQQGSQQNRQQNRVQHSGYTPPVQEEEQVKFGDDYGAFEMMDDEDLPF